MYNLIQGDCLQEMDKLIANGTKVDMILTDPPYGTTQCKWDIIIPFELMWERIWKIVKPNGAVCLFGSQPFTSKLVSSNLDFFKYSLIWKKTTSAGFAQAPYKFMTEHEDILIFSMGGCTKNSKNRMIFNPQNLIYCPKVVKERRVGDSEHRKRKEKTQREYISKWTNYPKSILEFKSEFRPIHPTQKPVALLEYLIKTYTNEGETVLDFTMGSGSTGVACINTNRNFIGIELDQKYYNIARSRLQAAQK